VLQLQQRQIGVKSFRLKNAADVGSYCALLLTIEILRVCPANILGEKNLVKSLLISTLDKVISYTGTILLGSTKPHFTTQNRVEISQKSPFLTCFFQRIY
jgi:hypothetical protein